MDKMNKDRKDNPSVEESGRMKHPIKKSLYASTALVLEAALVAGCAADRHINLPSITGGENQPRPQEVPTIESDYSGILLDSKADLKFVTNVGRVTGVSEYKGSQALTSSVSLRFMQEKDLNSKDVNTIGFEGSTDRNHHVYIFLMVDNKGTYSRSDDDVYMAFRAYNDAQGNLESIDFITDGNWANSNDFTYVKLDHETLPDGNPAYLIRGGDGSITPIVVNVDGNVEYAFYTAQGKPVQLPVSAYMSANEIRYRIPGPNTPTPEAAKVTVTQPEATSTPTIEIKDYKVCSPENYRDCEVPLADMLNGSYLKWLQGLSKPFDSSGVLTPPLIQVGNQMMFYDQREIKFTGPESEPYRKGVTAGYLQIKEGEFGYEFWNSRRYVVLPVEIYDQSSPENNKWIITVIPIGNNKSEGEVQYQIKTWLSNKDLLIFTNPYYTGLVVAGNTKDPIVEHTFDQNHDMGTRFSDSLTLGNLTPLSKPGIILETGSTK